MHSKKSGCMKPSAITDLRSSTYSMSPEKEKNSLMSRSVAPKETLPTLTVFILKNEKNATIKTLKLLETQELDSKII